MILSLPYFHLDSDSEPNRLVVVDRKFWAGPALIPKFYEGDKKKLWAKYLNKDHAKNDIKTSKERLKNSFMHFIYLLNYFPVKFT